MWLITFHTEDSIVQAVIHDKVESTRVLDILSKMAVHNIKWRKIDERSLPGKSQKSSLFGENGSARVKRSSLH